MGPKLWKTAVIVKWSEADLGLLQHPRWSFQPLTIITKSFTFGLLADSVVKLSIEIDIFIKHPKNWRFLHFSIDSPVQCCPEKAS